jgi:hypothetical protein
LRYILKVPFPTEALLMTKVTCASVLTGIDRDVPNQYHEKPIFQE